MSIFLLPNGPKCHSFFILWPRSFRRLSTQMVFKGSKKELAASLWVRVCLWIILALLKIFVANIVSLSQFRYRLSWICHYPPCISPQKIFGLLSTAARSVATSLTLPLDVNLENYSTDCCSHIARAFNNVKRKVFMPLHSHATSSPPSETRPG